MNLEFSKNRLSDGNVGTILKSWHIYVKITAISKDEKKIAYAVQNMAYSLGYRMTKKEEGFNLRGE